MFLSFSISEILFNSCLTSTYYFFLSMNLLFFLSLNSSSSNKIWLILITSSSSISYISVSINSFFPDGATSSSRYMLFSFSISVKNCSTAGWTTYIPSIITNTAISSLDTPFLLNVAMLSATPLRVLFNIVLSSLYIQIQIANFMGYISFGYNKESKLS